jgi:hypothetical protein
VWTFRRIYRLMLASGLLGMLLVALMSTIASCVVFGAIVLGARALIWTWLPRGIAATYGLWTVLGMVAAQIGIGRRRRV